MALLAAAGVIAATATGVPAATTGDLDGGLVFLGQGYAAPTRYVDAYNALEGLEATSISSNYDHACVVDTRGGAVCWGREDNGRIGSGTRGTEYAAPARVRLDAVGNPTLSAVAAGGAHTCALSRSGRAFCWGSASSGRLGDGRTSGNAYVPVRVATSHLPSDLRWSSLTADKSHTCALDLDGRAFCWGRGQDAQLGTGGTRTFARPHLVAAGDISGRRLVAIDAGESHTCAVDAGGRVYCWGRGWDGRLGMGDERDRLVPRMIPGTGPDAVRFAEVSAGVDHTCAVTTDARLFCWGANGPHQVSTSNESNVLQPDLVEEITATSVSAGPTRTCAINESGAAWCWGTNGFGQVGDGTTSPAREPTAVLTDGVLAGRTLTAIDTGRWYSFAVDSEGQVYTWGLATRGKPETVVRPPNLLSGAELRSVDGAGFGLCVTDADDRILCPDSEFVSFAEVDTSRVAGTLNVATLSAHNQVNCVLDAGGAAYCWGWNLDGELGIGRRDKNYFGRPKPVVTSGVLNGVTLARVSVGARHTCAVGDGKAYCWGSGKHGVLGTGTTEKSPVPVAVVDDGALAGVSLVSIDAGQNHTCAVSDRGAVFCWGSQPGGDVLAPVKVRLGALTAGERASAVFTGHEISCLLTDAGRVYCWGKNTNGQLGAGIDANHRNAPIAVDTSGVLDGVRVTELAISSDRDTAVCALSANGRVFCWGGGARGMLGNGSYRDSTVPVRVLRDGTLADRHVTDIGATAYGMWLVTEPA